MNIRFTFYRLTLLNRDTRTIAGLSSVDCQNFAFPTDPIAQGFFMQSGTFFYLSLRAMSQGPISHSVAARMQRSEYIRQIFS